MAWLVYSPHWRFHHQPLSSLGCLDYTPHQALTSYLCTKLFSVSLSFICVMIYFWLSALQIPSRITWNTRIVYFLWFSSDAKIGRHLGGKALVELGRRNTKGCFPSVKVTSVLVTFGLQDAGQQIQTFSSVQHALNAFPQGQEEVVTIELSIHYAAIKPVKEWKIVKVNGWIESLFETEPLAWTHHISYDGHPS